MDNECSVDGIQDQLYRTKFVDVPNIIEDWLSEYDGLAGKDILEFGCGEGTMALGIALRKNARRVVGVEISDVHRQCLSLAQKQFGLQSLPENLELCQIAPGQPLARLGLFDIVYSWSVFEHVSQELLVEALASIWAILKPGGLFFLQISPLYYSANGSHLGPWISEPWAHLFMQQDMLHERLISAPTTPPDVRSEWSVYIPQDAPTTLERAVLWNAYLTLNKLTAGQLCRLVLQVGFTIIRDYRTKDVHDVPTYLKEVYNEESLLTQQIVLLLRKPL